MCLSIPAKVLSIEGNLAKVSIGGSVTDASLQLVDDVNVGDYVLLHTGFAIEKIDEKEAAETMRLLKELEDLSD
jgi:hydrogenase expression/formation protein HypC